jgi:hypothetical protein
MNLLETYLEASQMSHHPQAGHGVPGAEEPKPTNAAEQAATATRGRRSTTPEA